MKPARIVLADDHPLIREAIGQLVRGAPEFELVGEAVNDKECLARVQELNPDILVLDITMPEMSGEQVAHEPAEFDLAQVQVAMVVAFDFSIALELASLQGAD